MSKFLRATAHAAQSFLQGAVLDHAFTRPASGAAQIKDSPAPIARDFGRSDHQTDGSDVRDDSQDLARKARDAFRDACALKDADSSEASYLAVRSHLKDLWQLAKVRDRPFCDLLAILDAATRLAELADFNFTQRDVIRNAFQSLPKWLIGEDEVIEHIQKFAEFGIDITGPIRQKPGKKLRITIEEVE